MADDLLTLRGLVKTTIDTAKVDATPIIGEPLVFTSFTTEEAYNPHRKLEDLPSDSGVLYVIALAKDDDLLTRNFSYRSELPIQIAYQQKVIDTDTATLDKLVELTNQLRDVVRKSIVGHNGIAWMRNEALKDGNNTPYHYTGLRERSTFESYFTAYFQVSN